MYERMAQATRARLYMEPKGQTIKSVLQEEDGYIGQSFRLTCAQLRPVRVEKVVQLHTSRDVPPPKASTWGAMAGTVDLVQRCFTWLELRDNVLWPQPVLPAETGSLEFQLRYRSH